MEDNKKNLKLAIIFFGIALALFIVNKIVNYEGGPKKQLENLMEHVGKTYYEQVFYHDFNDKDNDYAILKSFEKDGITIDLDTAMYNIGYETDKFVNHKTNQQCDLKNSYIYIYPKSPYGMKDYKIDVNLSCGY